MDAAKMGWAFWMAAVVGLGAYACGTEGGDGAGAGAADATDGSVSGSTGSSGGSGGTITGAGGFGGSAYVPRFETDIVPLFEQSCGAGDNTCHSRVSFAANSEEDCRGWLSLEDVPLGSTYCDKDNECKNTGCPDMPLYDRLLMDAWQCGSPVGPGPRVPYVVPCDPDASYLVRKMEGTPICTDPGTGEPFDPMPPDEDPPDGAIEMVRAWIVAGAPRVDDDGFDCGGGGAGGGEPTGAFPQPSISHPSDGATRPADKSVPLIGEAVDAEDGTLSGPSLVWKSDLDGTLGTGASIDVMLSVGTHVLSLEATDSDGNVATASITVTMTP